MVAFLSTGVFAGWVLWPAQVSFVVDADRCANLIAMPDQPTPAPNPVSARPEVGRMSRDVFIYENELSRKRAEARKLAAKRWLHRLLHRSHQPPS
jgi:hypothetical protein